ncbi:MAG: hypothetical protein RLZZ511_1539, partial [Cyanobacteriota bacterium]
RRVSSFLRRAIWVSPLFYLDSRPLTQNSEHSLVGGRTAINIIYFVDFAGAFSDIPASW